MMTELNGNITSFLHDLSDQVAGEHGVASALMHVGTPVEAWSVAACTCVHIDTDYNTSCTVHDTMHVRIHECKSHAYCGPLQQEPEIQTHCPE